MNKFLVVLALLFGISCFSFSDVTIVKNGTAVAVLVVSPEVMTQQEEPTDYYGQKVRVKKSVIDLIEYVEKISGAKLEIKSPTDVSDDKRVQIYIGESAAKIFGEVQKKSPYKQAWRYVVSGKGIGLIGESGEALSYAIYELLDRLGCRWYMPSDMGEYYPQMKTITLKETDISEIPPTVHRTLWYADNDFKRRNRLGGINYSGGHALEFAYVDKNLLKEHNDWNAEIGGKREINGRFCWANDEIANAVADGVIASADKNPTTCLSLGPDDGATFCECAKCKALDTNDWDSTMACVSITDRFMNFCNKIAEKVVKKHPNLLLGFLAYVQYTRPPVKENVHPNLVPQIAPITYCRSHSMNSPNCPSRQDLKGIVSGWAKKVKMFAYYEYGFNLAEVTAPNPMMTKWSDDLTILYDNGLTLWTPETLPNFETCMIGLYLGIRMSWNPKIDKQKMLDELFVNFYGSASEPMKKYWKIIDSAYINSPTHTGCGFGYPKIFTTDVMKSARTEMDNALASCKTAMEYRRVKLANDSFTQFERFMKMRYDLFDAKFAELENASLLWTGNHTALANEYEKQSAFGKMGWCPESLGVRYFNIFFQPAYKDASRIQKEFVLISPSLRKWKYFVDKDKKGEESGMYKPGFNDSEWQTTDPCIDMWSDLGLDAYFGQMWYRTEFNIPAAPEGKKTFLWVSSTDGSCKVFVNGQHVPWINEKGESKETFSGYCQPASFDITSAVKKDGKNLIAIMGTHDILNELGTGGLIGPVVIYREK